MAQEHVENVSTYFYKDKTVFLFLFPTIGAKQVIELQRRLDNARSQINRLSGINYNKDEQLHRLELLRNQLKQKQHLIKKYKNIQF